MVLVCNEQFGLNFLVTDLFTPNENNTIRTALKRERNLVNFSYTNYVGGKHLIAYYRKCSKSMETQEYHGETL